VRVRKRSGLTLGSRQQPPGLAPAAPQAAGCPPGPDPGRRRPDQRARTNSTPVTQRRCRL